MIKKKDMLITSIEHALDYGRFIYYKASYDFVAGLKTVESKINELIDQREAKRAVDLYEIFMAGCYEKMDEIDDSGGEMGMFFEELFCSWINARQKSGLDSRETIKQILKWMDNDDYGLCFQIEKSIVNILDKKAMSIFEEEIYARFDKAFLSECSDKKNIYNYSYKIRQNVDILKVIYIAKNDVDNYLSLCEKIGITPKDCEAIGSIYKSKKQWQEALRFVIKGLSLEKEKDWPNHSSYCLSDLKRELLSNLGYKEEALQAAWEDFMNCPSEYSYKELMKYIPGKDKKLWHDKALAEAKKGELSSLIGLCIMTKEWDILAERILNVSHHALEEVGFYTIEKAIKTFEKKYWNAAAKVHRALGMRILYSKKSKYYHYALDHFQKAKELYEKSNLNDEWLSVVENVRKDHFRKYSFIEDFEDIVKGVSREEPSFLEIAQERWNKQLS